MTRHLPDKGLAEEQGYTLVEVVVAVALLLAVLVPAGAALTAFAGQRPGERLALATRSAQSVLEQTLSERAFTTDTLSIPSAPWPLHRTVRRERGLVMITVATGPPRSSRPLVTLTTARLDPLDGEVPARMGSRSSNW